MSYVPHTVWVGGPPKLPPPVNFPAYFHDPRGEPQRQVAAWVQNHPGGQAKIIADSLGMEHTTVCRILRKLHKLGMLTYTLVLNTKRAEIGGSKHIKLWSAVQ